MSDNNEWTGQPGVPCEHQNRRSHWLQGPLGEVFICGWIPINKVGIWVRDHATITPANITPQHKYLGPVLTPAEVDARVADALKWRGAINDALTNWLSPIEDHETPADALQRLIRLEVMAALDPKVSQAAADLVAQARREALEEAARWHDEQAERWQNTYAKETLSGLDMQATRILCLERGGLHIESAAAIRALSDTPPGMVLVPRDREDEARAAKIVAERNQLIGILQLVVEQSGDMDKEPAWFDAACRILNAGFTRAVKGEGND